MSKTKILIIGDGRSVFVLNHVKNIKKTEDSFCFDILLTNSYLKQEYLPYFNEVFPTYRDINPLGIAFLKGAYIRISIFLSILFFKKKYDFVHIQFLNDNIIYLNRFKKIGKKLVASVWGSDFYRSKGLNLWFKKRILEKADIISFANEQTREDFTKAINTNAELKICRFGLLSLDYLESLNASHSESKTFLNIPLEKIIITIGYNLNPNQQHLKILDELKKLKSKNYYSKLFLMIPITYPADKNNYKSELIKALNSTGIAYKIIEDFLPEIENAHLRNSSDIMIQLQTSDQLSGTMQEYLYSDNIVITGSWLPYTIFLKKGINMILINSFAELSTVLDKTISNIDSLQASVSKNKSVILEMSSWKNNTQAWIDLYS